MRNRKIIENMKIAPRDFISSTMGPRDTNFDKGDIETAKREYIDYRSPTLYLHLPRPSIDDSRFISSRRSTESGVSAASIYLHTQDSESEKEIRMPGASIAEKSGGGGGNSCRSPVEEESAARRPRRAGSSNSKDRWSRNPVGRALMRRGGSRYVREDATSSV